MEQLFLSFDAASGVVSNTAANFIANKPNVIFRGISSSLHKAGKPGETVTGEIQRFTLAEVWDYNTSPATKTNQKKLCAVVKVGTVTAKISLREDQTSLFVGQAVQIQLNDELYSPDGKRTILSGEIL